MLGRSVYGPVNNRELKLRRPALRTETLGQ